MDGNQVVILDKGDYTTCAVNLQGATITSWRIENEEQIFLGRRTLLSYLGRTRGGITLAFPREGIWDFGNDHGFVRDLMWNLESGPITKKNGDVFAEFSLKSDAYTESQWNFQFVLLSTITLRERQLEIRIIIENMSDYLHMEFNYLHHSYLRVADVTKCKIKGLKNCRYWHHRDPERNTNTERRVEVTISNPNDLVYEGVPKDIFVDLNGNWEKVMKITKANLPDLNLWNPGAELTKDITGLDEDEYKYFVAVDFGRIAKKMHMYPRTCWRSSQTYELIEPKKSQYVFSDFYDYFEGIC